MTSKLLPPYKKYYGSVNADIENNCLYGRVEFIRALVTYEANDVKDLVKAFQEAVDDYLSLCEYQGIEPEQPFKGSFNVRIGTERHKKALIAAKILNKSLNEYICQALDKSLMEEDIIDNEKPNELTKNMPQGKHC